MGMTQIQYELIHKSNYSLLKIGEAKEFVEKYKEYVKPGNYRESLIKTLGKEKTTQLYTCILGLEIIENTKPICTDNDKLLEIAVSRIGYDYEISFSSEADTIQSYMKDWVAHYIVESEFSNLSFDSVMNIIHLNTTIRKLFKNIPPTMKGESNQRTEVAKALEFTYRD